ncbi:MAG: DUF4160 domain-containing protein [Bacillota bacterium]|nr:DUF4160 domain-containing protein [Bacillota bacterium]MDD3298429.1 DUF4160 domain-containing protein [Bacillota bacterium]MDD3851633.1 DUF4160 domain-containing protein [Bacillota bacterium]
MPLISQFYGILIYLYRELNAKHKMPHIHAQYGEHEMSVSFDGDIIAGSLPTKQRKLVEAWIVLHEDELRAAWKVYNESGEIIKIKGLE